MTAHVKGKALPFLRLVRTFLQDLDEDAVMDNQMGIGNSWLIVEMVMEHETTTIEDLEYVHCVPTSKVGLAGLCSRCEQTKRT